MATTTLEPRSGTYRRSWVIEWLTTVDHKKIGILYIVNSFLFFFAGGILALVIRSELAVPGMQFLDHDTYNQTFTMHADVCCSCSSSRRVRLRELHRAAPDRRPRHGFPRINALSFWMLPAGRPPHLLRLPLRRRRGGGDGPATPR